MIIPQEFLNSQYYSKIRIVVDATELFIEQPSDLVLLIKCYYVKLHVQVIIILSKV